MCCLLRPALAQLAAKSARPPPQQTPPPLLQAYSATFNGGGEAAVEATPRKPQPLPSLCTGWIRPGAPADLAATPKGRGVVELCWGPPDNGGCVDEVRAEEGWSGAVAAVAAALPWSARGIACCTPLNPCLLPSPLLPCSTR